VRIPTAQEILGEQRQVHTAEQLASAMFFLGAPRQPIPRAKLFTTPVPARKPYAVVHPVAAAPEKTWPAERFRSVAEHLSGQGLEPVFIAGPEDDLSAFQPFRTIVGAPLAEIKSLVRGATLFIGNDSGPAHMAAAFGIPVVVMFGPSDPVVWAPWRTEAEVLTSPAGIEKISTEQVVGAVDHLRVAQ
jgi:ADP-heptose:LPS heptosyltransferase